MKIQNITIYSCDVCGDVFNSLSKCREHELYCKMKKQIDNKEINTNESEPYDDRLSGYRWEGRGNY